LIDRELS